MHLPLKPSISSDQGYLILTTDYEAIQQLAADVSLTSAKRRTKHLSNDHDEEPSTSAETGAYLDRIDVHAALHKPGPIVIANH